MNRRIKLIILLALLVGGCFGIVTSTQAQTPTASPLYEPDLGYHEIRDSLPFSRFDIGEPPAQLAEKVLDATSYALGFLAFLGILVSGIMIITAGGDPDKAKKGVNNIIWIITGIVIYIVSLMILPVTRGLIMENFIFPYNDGNNSILAPTIPPSPVAKPGIKP